MDLTVEQRVQMLIGQQVIETMALRMENEKLKVQVAAASKPGPEPRPKMEPHIIDPRDMDAA